MSRWINVTSQPKTPDRIKTCVANHNEWLVVVLTMVWAGYVFFHNISSYPVETDEALYAAVGRQIARSGTWFHLEHQGVPYFNKPPLHFWLIAVATKVFGENDFAVHFPSAAMGWATTLLIYLAGRRLFNRRTAIAAALIASTTYNLIWLAPQAKMDVELGFWLNLAVYSFLLAYRKNARQNSVLALSFVSMTIATLPKGPIGVLLPGFASFVFLVSTRKSKAIRELPALAIGSAVVLGITAVYFLALGPDFNHYFFIVENLNRITETSKPIYFYSAMIFADLFPWSVFIPGATIALWKSGSLKPGTDEFALAIWLLDFFFFLNVPSYKEEDFLVFLVPPFTLLMARSWDQLLTEPKVSPDPGVRYYRAALISLSCAVSLLLWIGPRILQIRHPGFPSMIHPFHWLFVLVGCLAAIYVALKHSTATLFSSACIFAMALTFFFAHFYRPARGQHHRVRAISHEVRTVGGDSPMALSITHGSTEFFYYLDRREPIRFVDKGEARRLLRSIQKIFALLLRDVYEELKNGADFSMRKLAEFTHRDWRYVLVSN